MNAQFLRYRQEIILNASAFSAAEVIDCARRPTDAYRPICDRITAIARS
jgi:hypothetical protein